ncbi:MAG TPA: hypothetical protein VH161_01480 [Candidatus Acidoferrales bacterium]|nr:hypothetical protein [Candidatus Acidoferrales bacterium]
MLKLGIMLTAATVTILVAEFFRARRRPFPAHGWLGLFALIACEYLMFHGIEPVATYFSPLAWTSYILIADAAIFAISGESRLRGEARGLLKMAALSIPLWLVFEAYNLRLANWTYVGLPEGRIERWIGYGWAFATITPGIFMTAALIESFGWFAAESRPLRISRTAETASAVLGGALLLVPLLAPQRIAAYLFALVWVGFLFLLEPLNYRLHLPSFAGDFARGYRGRLYSFLAAGWVCGWLWEFWNYWARTGWIYTFPIGQDWKIFQMPAPGYLAFPVYALECFVMYVFGAWLVSPKYVAEKKYSA